MLSQAIAYDVFQYSSPGDLVVNCGKYSAVQRDGRWTMERNRTLAELESEFYRTTSKADILKTTRSDWQRECEKNVKDGKIREDRKEYYITGFIDAPFLFDEKIARLECFSGELTPADEAWIKNTRELIEKYHVLYEEALARDREGMMRTRKRP
jgi:hypothetical protein